MHLLIVSSLRRLVNTLVSLILHLSNALKIEIEKRKDITDDIYRDIESFLDNLDRDHYNDEWLVDTTEKWCKERAIYLALMESVKIADGQDKTRQRMLYLASCLTH